MSLREIVLKYEKEENKDKRRKIIDKLVKDNLLTDFFKLQKIREKEKAKEESRVKKEKEKVIYKMDKLDFILEFRKNCIKFNKSTKKDFKLQFKKDVIKYKLELKMMKELEKIEKRNNKHYYYMITFTTTDKTKKDEIEEYIKDRLKKPKLYIERCDLAKENEDTNLHYHTAIKAKNYIAKDRFKYYEDNYGYVNISKNKRNNYNTILNYITKQGKSEKII